MGAEGASGLVSSASLSQNSSDSLASQAPIPSQAALDSAIDRPMPAITDTAILNKFERMQGEFGPGQKDPTAMPVSSMSMTEILIRLFLSLGVVIAMIWGLVFLLKKLQKSKFNPVQDSGLQVLEALHLGHQQRVLVVRVQDRILALGVTPHTINTLADLTNDEAYQYLEAGQNAQQFSNTVDHFLRHFRRGGESAPKQNSPVQNPANAQAGDGLRPTHPQTPPPSPKADPKNGGFHV